VVVAALASGLLGAFFSRMIGVQRSWSQMTLDEVFLHRELSYTLLRAGVGMCGALIVYFFLRSGLVSGALFPTFQMVALEYVEIKDQGMVPMTFVMPSPALALLTVWCFLAGFSEALVPNILANTERQLSQASASAQKSGNN
jgi:membrane associated rhomboid family serine protease